VGFASFPFVFMHGAWSYARLFWMLTENAGEINLAAVGGGCAVHCWGVYNSGAGFNLGACVHFAGVGVDSMTGSRMTKYPCELCS